jgi:hypothetical protein
VIGRTHDPIWAAVPSLPLARSQLADSAEPATAATRSPKQAAIVATEQARALAAGGQLDHACDLAMTAYDIGYSYDSERVRQAVRDFRASLDPRAPQRIAAGLDERLHSAYTTQAT